MPKINVYLPDDLAAAVREAAIPVSPVCQKALSDAVRLVGRGRKTVAALRDPGFDPAAVPQIASRLGSLMTPRLHEAIRLAQVFSASSDRVETKHLLVGLLDEGDNLGARVLEALDVDFDELRKAAARIDTAEPGPVAASDTAEGGSSSDRFRWSDLSLPARLAFASMLEASIDLGHNYLGCEHLLLGLLDGKDTGAARLLQGFSVTKDSAQRAVTTAIAGFAHARATTAQVEATNFDQVVRRLEAIESRLTSMGA
jgi:ATP-dependent Clp protease ATP-binding subunit ClpA